MDNTYDKDDYNLYVLAELSYRNQHSNEKDIFPNDWYSMQDYKYKVEILAEAIANKKIIEETYLYQTRYDNHKFIL